MNIQPIVEGVGEVQAVPVLLGRLRDLVGEYDIDVNFPIRRTRAQLADPEQVRDAVEIARREPDCAAILLLFDADDDCPKELAAAVLAAAQEAAVDVPCAVVLANREYEAWFLASIESLRGSRGIRGDAVSHPSPETPRGAKSHLRSRMVQARGYREAFDQPALSQLFDLAAAHRACRSFRKLVKAYGELLSALGASLPDPWPPAAWLPEAQP